MQQAALEALRDIASDPVAAAAMAQHAVVTALLEVVGSDHAGAGCTLSEAGDKVRPVLWRRRMPQPACALCCGAGWKGQPTLPALLHPLHQQLPTAHCTPAYFTYPAHRTRHPDPSARTPQEALMWQHKNQKLAALAVALLAMKQDTRKVVVEAQAALVLTDCLRRSKGEGAAQLLRIAAAAALTPLSQDDKSRSKVKLAGERVGWCMCVARVDGMVKSSVTPWEM